MIYASVEAVAEQWRPLDSRETAAAARLLERVSALMRVYSPNLDARVAADPDMASVAAGIAVDAVIRVLRSLAAADEAGGAAGSLIAAATLYLTRAEIQALAGASNVGTSAFTIRPGGLAAPPAPSGPGGWW